MSRHPSAQPAGEVPVGPLALQMGTITGAVDDLVHGYEHLVHSLPNLTSQICNVHADTEQMAKQLEHRTRSLVDGYEYLQGLSTQLPDMFRETASAHRKTLQDAVSMVTPEELKIIAEQEQVLLKVRSELQSISHERVIMDVLMRPAINETKRIHAHAQGESALVNHKRYARGITENATRNAAVPARQVNAAPGTGRVQVADDRDTAVVIGNRRRHSTSATTNVSFKNTAEQLSTPIHIPQYTPDLTAAVTARREAARQQQSVQYTNTIEQTSTGAVGFGQRYAHNTRDTSTLPAMRTGSLPAEIANLVTEPRPLASASEMERNFRKRTTVRRVRKETKYVEREPLAKSLADKLGHTEEEVQQLKTRLSHASQHFDKDQGKAIKKLQQLVEELQGQQSSKDRALLAAVEAMLKEALAGNKKPENRDAEILKALESLLVPPKQVALVDRLHEYKVLTARSKQPVVPRTVPVIVPVPVQVQEKPKCVEVQTEPLPAPVVVSPPVPAPVVQQVPQPPPPAPEPAAPVIVQVPAQTGVERELIELMQAVVTAQQQTMQGNQALILSLIHERNAQPEPVIRDDVSEMSEETPPPAPAPAPAPVVERAPTPPPLPRAPSPPRYSTAFGSVVLGGELMVGPYATQPAVIPSDQKPCVLRGIPLPSSRKPRPADFSGAVPNQREGTSDGNVRAEVAAPEGKVAESPSTIHVVSTDPHEHSAPVDSELAPTVPAVPAVGPVMQGLEGNGVSSTAGRGGSHQHSTPGAIQNVPTGSIPPHMRRIASAFTMRALAEAPQDRNASSTGTADAITNATAVSVPGDLITLLRNLQILSGSSVPASTPASQPITAELIAEKISEGVQLGVKQALGLLDAHHPHKTSHRAYFDATPRPNARHGDQDRRGLLSADDQQDEVRHSLQLLKSRRGGGAGARKRGTPVSQESVSASDSLSSGQFNADNVRSTYYSRLPHVTNNTNDIHHNADVDRDIYQPPRRRELAGQEERAQQAEIVKEMEFSRQQARRLLATDENSSFNDSVSLDEETAAHLRDPLMYYKRDDVSEMSSVDFGDHNNVHLVQRDEHTQRHLELFASQDAPKVRSDLPARVTSSPVRSKSNNTRHAAKHSARGDNLGLGIVPLVSRVLHQSATEEVLQDPRKFGVHRSDNNNCDKHRREERDLTASAEEHMWDLDVTAPLVAASTASRPGPGAAVSHSSESDSTRSILSLSTNSSSESSRSRVIDGLQGGTENADDGSIPHVDGALSMAKGPASGRLKGSASSSPAVSSSVDSYSTSSSEGRRPRQSLLPRYSAATRGAPAPRRSSSRSRSSSRERTRVSAKARSSVPDRDVMGANTDRLAAQLMLNVLELHKPSNYTVQPYLTNPISAHVKGRSASAVLKRSKMYATESVESSRSDDRDAHHSDLNCTGSSVSSDDENLLDAVTHKSNNVGGLKLMGLGNCKLLTFRK